jgi:hypothetical protein
MTTKAKWVPNKKGLDPAKVIEAITHCRGLLAPAAERLGVSRTNLRGYIGNHSSCMKALKESREALGDLAEKKLFELIEQGDFKAIQFYLNTLCRDRGYGWTKDQMPMGDTGVGVITTINILAVPSGRYLTAAEVAELEGQPPETYQPKSRSSEHLRLIDGDGEPAA